ncbi:MAG: cupin domain-containing protein [Halobacteriaceae archaeon]
MVHTDMDAERAYDDARFGAQVVQESERSKTVCAYFEPGQFIPVHAPNSDVTVAVQSGTGVVRDGDTEHEVEPGDVVVVPAGTDRGVRAAADGRLEALLVTAPPPGDAAHEPVREGIRTDTFDP